MIVSMIEELYTNNAQIFWKHIKNIGPETYNTVPLKLCNPGTLNITIDAVIKHGKLISIHCIIHQIYKTVQRKRSHIMKYDM